MGAPRAHRVGRPPGPRHLAHARTRDRLLAGALEAASRYGLAKVSMSDVSAAAGVSRGTAYRYFGSVEALLLELGRREVEHFEARVREAMAGAGGERLSRGLEFAAAFAGSHPLLERLPHTDPALVLDSLRERFPEIRASFERLFADPFAATPAVRTGLLSTEQLVDWTARLFVSLFLFPGAEPGEIARGLGALHRLAAGGQPTALQE